MKKTALISVALMLVLMLVSCTEPDIVDDGFLGTDKTVSGGVAIDEVNLKEINVSSSNDVVDIAFDFVAGSKNAQGNEESIKGLPQYYISFCENPTRLVLGIKDLKYWDYQQNGALIDHSGLVQGVFKVLPAGSRTYTQIYINLSAKVSFKVSEQDGKLVITLKKNESKQTLYYYVYGNLINEYQSGAIDDEAGLTPTISKDRSSVLMISRAFESQQEAESFKAELENNFSYLLVDKKLKIYSSASGDLPDYADSGLIGELSQMLVVNRGGISENAPLAFVDGRPVCVSHDGTKTIFARMEDNNFNTEILFVVHNDGSQYKLTEYETTAIAQAEFSPNDKYLFYIEQIDGAMLVNVYDFDRKKQTSVDEEVLGTYITGAAWASDSSGIYFLSGEDMLSIKKYDVAGNSISEISNGDFIESEIYCSGNDLYYNTVDSDEEALVKMDISTGKQTVLTQGEYFTMDTKGNSILLKKRAPEGKDILAIYDIANGEEVDIASNVMLGQYFFSADCTKVYYVLDNGNDDFAYSVYCYDIASKNSFELFKTVKCELGISGEPEKLYLQVGYDKNEGSVYPATFLVNIK